MAALHRRENGEGPCGWLIGTPTKFAARWWNWTSNPVSTGVNIFILNNTHLELGPALGASKPCLPPIGPPHQVAKPSVKAIQTLLRLTPT
jgi:hypothetical protein